MTAGQRAWFLRDRIGYPLAMVLIGTSGAFAQDTDPTMTNATVALLLILVAVIGTAIYFIPTIVAFRRGHPNRWAIFVINFVFGGTGLGWLGSLVWAFNAVHKSPTGSDGGESGLNIFINDPVTVRTDPAAPPPTDTVDPGAQLRRLKQLYEQGAIDEEEYRQLKRPWIERLAQ